MKLLQRATLAGTLDAVNDILFNHRPLGAVAARTVAAWLAERQGQVGSYFGLPAPTPQDLAQGIQLFTGEPIAARFHISSILGHEACRGMILLDRDNPHVQAALHRAEIEVIHRLDLSSKLALAGTGAPPCALWRHLAVGGLNRQEQRLAQGLKVLRQHRKTGGTWHRFPFYYTVLALSEIDLPAAKAELRHAAPACRNRLPYLNPAKTMERRRRMLLERVV